MLSRLEPSHQEARAPWASQGEVKRITDLQKELEYRGSFVASATRCRGLGWRLAAVDARELADLEVNFSDAPEVWLQNLGLLGPLQGRVGLGVHTGSTSRLLVLEVNSEVGRAALNQGGNWRSICRARVNGREQHYYALPQSSPAVSTSFLSTAQVMVYGENGLAPVPPSVDLHSREIWRWLKPPWDYPPPEAPPPVWSFLRRHLPLPPETAPELKVPSWEEVYRLISPHEQMLKAVLAPTPSLEEYYRNLLQAALDMGFRDPTLLLGLLWHAPQAGARPKPERWGQFKAIMNELQPVSPANGEPLEVTGETRETAEADDLKERCRYEAILDELRRLSHQASALESLLSEMGQDSGTAQTPAPLDQETLVQDFGGQSVTSQEEGSEEENLLTLFEGRLYQGFKAKLPAPPSAAPAVDQSGDEACFSFSDLPQKPTVVQPPELMEAAIRASLERNPDLADDPLKVQMIHYCLTNYVNIDPEMSELTLQERVERASQMAREFLGGGIRA